uniref:Chemokine interleukin-8-like domain-containing protein n=1 Tax=Amphiprion percula TaxID=161767 RepID=A0A3P8TCG4_AMPPE
MYLNFTGANSGDQDCSCCVEVSRMRIPLSEITRYYRTMPRHPCVLITKNGEQICADPNDKWTQRTYNAQ